MNMPFYYLLLLKAATVTKNCKLLLKTAAATKSCH